MSLVENINRRRRLGISRPKSKSTISPEAYKAMKNKWKDKAKIKKKYTGTWDLFMYPRATASSKIRLSAELWVFNVDALGSRPIFSSRQRANLCSIS